MSVIDQAAFDRLIGVIGREGLKSLLETCIDDLANGSRDLCSAIETQDKAKVRRVAHMLAGVLAQYGCLEAGAQARALSHATEEDVLSGAGHIVTSCRAAMGALRSRYETL